jgi:chromosome segregation ATPase
MVSPYIRNPGLPPDGRPSNMNKNGHHYHSPISAERAINRIRQSPLGMTIISPVSSVISGNSSPSRKQIIERGRAPPTTSQRSARSRHSKESDQRDQTGDEVKVLHERFNLIQLGLGSIDQERALLVDKAKNLEEEKATLEQQLELRDKEIHALVKRCATQEGKIREYSKLRAENRGLSNELQNMLEKLESKEEDTVDLSCLRQQLQDSETAREELQKRLDWVQKEHDCIVETMSDCLHNIKVLTEEKQFVEDERRRERKRAEMEIEKQRLSTLQVANDLKAELQEKQQQIDLMESFLKNKTESFEREAAESIESERKSFHTEKTVLENQISEMRQQLGNQIKMKERAAKESLENERKSFESQITEMKYQLDQQVEEIRKEVSDKKKISDTVQMYENEINEIRQQLEQRVKEIKRKEASDRKSTGKHESNIEEMRKKIEDKEDSNNNFNGTINGLRKQLDQRAIQLKGEEESNKRFHNMKKEMESMMDEIMATHEKKVSKMQHQIDQQVADFKSNNGKIDKKVAVMRQKLEEKDSKMNDLEHEFSEQMEELMKKQITLDKTEEERKELATHIANLKHIEDEHEALVQYIEIMDSNIAELTTENGILLVEKENLVNDKNDLKENLLKTEQEMTLMCESYIGREGELQGRFQAERAQLETDIGNTQDEVASLQVELQKRKSWILKVENELNESRRRIAEKEDELIMAKKEKKKLRSSLEASLNQAQHEINRLKHQVSSQEKNIVSLEDKLEWEKTIQTQRSDIEEEIESLTASLKEEKDKALSFEKKFNDLIKLQKGEEMEIEEKKKQVASMEEKVQELAVELDQVVVELSNRDLRICELEDRACFDDNKMRELEEEINILVLELSEREKEIDSMTRLQTEKKVLEGSLAEALEEIALLGQEGERRDKKIVALENEITSLNDSGREEAFIESENQRMHLEGLLAELRRQNKELLQSLESKERLLAKTDKDLEKAQNILAERDGILEENQQRYSHLEGTVSSLERQLASRDEDLMRVDEHLDGSINDIAKKEAEIHAMKKSIVKKDAELEDALLTMKKEKENNSHLQEKFCDCQMKNSTYEGVLGQQSEIVSSLRKQLAMVNETNKQESSELEKELRKVKTEMALKDDEIRDLKMFDLKDAEEEIAMLRSTLESKGKLERELSEKDSLLNESHNVIDELVLKQGQLEQREKDMLSECDRLLRSESDTKRLLEKNEADMEALLIRERKSAETNLQKTQDSRDKKISNLSAELHTMQQKLREAEGTVKDRSTLLAEFVDHKKDLEMKVEAQHKKLSDLEDETNEGRLDLETKRGEIINLRRDFYEKEISLKKQLKEERKSKELIEDSLQQMKRKVTEATKYKNQVIDLEKAIESLRDKVKRQEAYMEKKLQQEKSVSRRSSLISPIKSKATPSMVKPSSTRTRISGIPGPLQSSSTFNVSERSPSARGGGSGVRSRLPTSLGLKSPTGFRSPGLRKDLD